MFVYVCATVCVSEIWSKAIFTNKNNRTQNYDCTYSINFCSQIWR